MQAGFPEACTERSRSGEVFFVCGVLMIHQAYQKDKRGSKVVRYYIYWFENV